MAATVWLQEMTWEEVQAKLDSGKKTLLLPVGSTEQHGPHLPVGTDTMVAVALAEAAARRAAILAAPPCGSDGVPITWCFPEPSPCAREDQDPLVH